MPDGNGGQPLPANPLFGELVMGAPVLVPLSTVPMGDMAGLQMAEGA